jgi:hypothetical protein
MHPVPDSQPFEGGSAMRAVRQAEAVQALESLAPGAFALFSLGASPARIAGALVSLLGLGAIVHVAIPVMKTFGMCWSARVEARLRPSKRGRGGRSQQCKQ